MIFWKRKQDNRTALESILTEFNLSQEQFNEAMNITPKSFRFYNNKESFNAENVPLNFLNKLCTKFNKSLDDLIEYREDYKEIEFKPVNNFNDLVNKKKQFFNAIDNIALQKANNLKILSDYIQTNTHKPLVTFVGSKESDKNTFISKLLKINNISHNNLEFFINKEDIPEKLINYRKLAIKPMTDDVFNIFLINNSSYMEKLKYEEYSLEKKYDGEYIFINISDSSFLKNCVILSFPDLQYIKYRKSSDEKAIKYLSNRYLLDFIKYEFISNLVVYFEVISNFFTVERTAIVQYLLDRHERLENNEILLVGTKAELFPVHSDSEQDMNLIQKIKEDNSLKYLEEKNKEKKYLYLGPFSFNNPENNNDYIKYIESLTSDFSNSNTVIERIDFFIKKYIENCSSTISDSLKHIEDNIDTEQFEIHSELDDSSDLRTYLTRIKDSEEIQLSIKDNIESKKKLLSSLQNIASQFARNYSVCDFNFYKKPKIIPIVQLILNNLLIPYFLTEGSLKTANEKKWAEKIQNEILNFQDTPEFAGFNQYLI